MAKNVIGGKTDGEEIGGWALAEFFAGDELARKFKLVIVGEGSGADEQIETRGLSRGRGGGAQNMAVRIFPVLMQIFFGSLAVIEIFRPPGKRSAVIRRCDPSAGVLVDPVGGVGGVAAGKD